MIPAQAASDPTWRRVMQPGVGQGHNLKSHGTLTHGQYFPCASCGMLVNLKHEGTPRECGGPRCASDGLRRPSHRTRYALRQLEIVERLVDGESTLIATTTRAELTRTVLGSQRTLRALRSVFERIREL